MRGAEGGAEGDAGGAENDTAGVPIMQQEDKPAGCAVSPMSS